MPSFTWEDFLVRESPDRKGVGLFATRKFEKGESIYPFDYWSEDRMPLHATNHSCDPNGGFSEEGMLVALRDIETHDEITYDYLSRPIPASPWNFKCQCKSENCLGWISM